MPHFVRRVRSRAVRVALVASLVAAPACTNTLPQRHDAGVTADSGFDAETPLDAPGDDAGAVLDAPGVDAPDPGIDDATIVAAVFPRALGCTARTVVIVTVQNTGSSTWSGDAGYALGAVGDADPLHTADTRVPLAAGEMVAPGASHDFVVSLAAPGTAGAYTTDWQMVRDGAAWFGGVASQSIDVWCETVTPADFDLATVTIVSSPEVRDFAVTSTITSLSFSPGTIHIDHTLRGTWPPVVIAPDGTTQEATIWVFFHIGGVWYATGGERLRPAQTDKALSNPSQLGSDWLYDYGRWGVMTAYVPSPGDLVGFMVVAGSTRSDDHVIVRERTDPVLVPFPSDDVTTTFPPFAM